MRASIVPQRRARRALATGIVALVLCALAPLVFLRALAGEDFAGQGVVGEAPGRTDFAGAKRASEDAIAAEPTFSAREHVALWMDDFNAPPTPEAGADPRNHFGRYLTLGLDGFTHAPGAGPDGSAAARIEWTAREGRECRDDSRVLEAWFPESREVFIQFSVRYEPGFVFDWSAHRPCAGNAKKLFLLWAREGSRFVFISENGALGIGSDHDHPLFAQNRAVAVTPAALADGRWHRITFHIAQGSGASSHDGFLRGWIDGVQRWSYTRVRTYNAGGYYLFKMPATFNQGSPVDQVEWVDELRIWRPRD